MTLQTNRSTTDDARPDDARETHAPERRAEAQPGQPAQPAPSPPEAAPRAAVVHAVAKPATPARRKGSLRLVLMLGGVGVVAVASAWGWIGGGRVISADNAYVRAAKLMVSTDVSGLIASIDVRQGQTVKAGDVLFRVDPRQFQISLAAAKANLDQVRLNLQAAQQDYIRLQSDIAAVSAQVDLAQTNFDRAAALAKENAGTRAQYDQARFTLAAAQKQLESLRQQSVVAQTRLGGDPARPVEQHPQFLQASAQIDEVQRQLDHTVVKAPFAGIVTGVDSLQPGMFLVSATAALTSTGAIGLIATDRIWIEANLKETDLTFTKIGDPVEATIDAYPGRVWHAHVDSISPATGSEFSLIPAQNASGNWVKVVQRVPVRIALDLKPDDPLLRAGMSAVVEIDTGHHRQWSDLWSGWFGGHGG